MKLEVCVDSYESAKIAADSLADRLELCLNLKEGGLTPTAGLISAVKKYTDIPVFVLIRPHSKNFHYNQIEVEQMKQSIIMSKQAGADGLVFGALTKENEVDKTICAQLIAESSGLPVTFHRAFDIISNKRKALEDLIDLGFQRVLTSGGTAKAVDSTETLHDLVKQGNGRIIVMPGGNINNDNIFEILLKTNAVEFHSSARVPITHLEKSDVCSATMVLRMRCCLINGATLQAADKTGIAFGN